MASVKVPLQQILESVRKSTDINDNYIATVALVACDVGQKGYRPSLEHLVALHGRAELAQDLKRQMDASFRMLQEWCAGYSSSDLLEYVAKQVPGKDDGAAWRSLVRPSEPGTPWYERQQQDISLILLNPRKHALAFDRWLSGFMHLQVDLVRGLGPSQQMALRDYLYHELTGESNDPSSLRTLILCAAHQWCPATQASVPQPERAEALAIGHTLADLIRQQRFDEFLRPRE